MTDRISIESIPEIPFIEAGHDVGQALIDGINRAGMTLQENDIICVASKAISSSEGRVVALNTVQVSEVAEKIYEQIPRKDPRTIQLIIDQTGQADGSRVELGDDYIAGWLPNGMRLTSAGVDKAGSEKVILLPEDSDKSARVIGKKVLASTGVNVGIIVTDSDGRVEKRGSTQLAIGLYGVPAIRISKTETEKGKPKVTEETICDMLAASAALLMGQRGTNKPAILIRGFNYTFDKTSSIVNSLSRPN